MRSWLTRLAVMAELLAAGAAITATFTIVQGSPTMSAWLLGSVVALAALATLLKVLRLRYPPKPSAIHHLETFPAARQNRHIRQ
jgi:hypothetical protein